MFHFFFMQASCRDLKLMASKQIGIFGIQE